MRRARSSLILILAVAALIAPAAQAAEPPTVFINGDSIGNYKFTPRTSEIARRQTVHWQWDSNAPHNVTFSKLGKSSVTGASETYKLKFKQRGTFKYSCTVHGFRGKVVVK